MVTSNEAPVDWSALNESALARRYRDASDECAFNELYRRVTPTVEKAFRRWGRGLQLADVKQEVHLRLLKRIATGADPPSNCQGWIYGATLKVTQEQRRRDRRAGTAHDPHEFHVADDHDLVAQLEAAHTLGKFEPALASFGEAYRQAFALHIDGFTAPEIALILGIGRSTAYEHLDVVRRQLLEYFDAMSDAPLD